MFPPCDDCLSVLSDPEDDFEPPTPSGLDLPTTSVVTFLSLISSPSKIPSNPASHDKTPASPLQFTKNPTTTVPDVASSSSTGLHFSILLPKTDQSKITEKLPPFQSLLSDAGPLLSMSNHLKLQPDQSALGGQHRRDYYTKTHAEQNDPASIRIYNKVSNEISPHGR